MTNDRLAIEQELRRRGLCVYWQRPNQLVVSRQERPVYPDRGNSFWVCKLAGHWYVCTWGPWHYRIPPEQSVADVCEAFVVVGDEAQAQMPPDLIARFSVVETDHDDWERLWDADA